MKRIISGLLLTTMIANTTVQAKITEDWDNVKVSKHTLPAGFDNALLSKIQLNDNKSYTDLRDVEFLTSRPASVDPSTRDALALGTLASSPEEDSWFPMDAISENAKKPLVLINEKDGSKKINENYIGFQRTIHIMNDLSYAIAKRQGYGDELNKWSSELNKTQKDYAAFKASTEEEGEVNDDEFLDLRKELTDRDYQRHIEFCKWKIKELEKKVIENINRSNEHFKLLGKQGWEWKVIEGKTGYKSITGSDRAYVPDDRGFVAYQKSTKTIIVVYHGSRNEKDWDTNFDGQAVTALDVGLKLPDNPLLHRGFGHAVASCEQQVKDAIRDFVREHEEENKGNRKDLNIYVTGHSQGAAVASISFMDLAINLGKELFGEGYKNAEKNNFKGVFFSAPRAFARGFGDTDNKSLALLNENVGADNMMRQNVHGDAVPHASKKAIGALEGWFLEWADFFGLRKLSFFQKPQFENIRVEGISLVDALKNASFVSYDSVGHLALDSVVAAQKRVWWDAAKAFWKRTTTNFVDVASNSIQRALGYEIPGMGIMGFIGNTAKDMVMTLVAPFHNGVLQEDAGGAFHPDVVGNDPDALLAAGFEHQKAKKTKSVVTSSPSVAPHQAEAGTVSQPEVVGQKPNTLPTAGLANEKVEIEPQPGVFERAKDTVTSTASSAWKAVKGWFGRK